MTLMDCHPCHPCSAYAHSVPAQCPVIKVCYDFFENFLSILYLSKMFLALRKILTLVDN